MFSVAKIKKHLPAMSPSAIAKMYALELERAKEPQIIIPVSHLLHGGVYSRTLMLPAKGVLTGALIKIPTTLILSGDVVVFVGEETIKLSGYNVLPGSANRKQAFVALTDTNMTMFFPTKAKTIEEAENEFTDEGHLLFSRHSSAVNNVTITRE